MPRPCFFATDELQSAPRPLPLTISCFSPGRRGCTECCSPPPAGHPRKRAGVRTRKVWPIGVDACRSSSRRLLEITAPECSSRISSSRWRSRSAASSSARTYEPQPDRRAPRRSVAAAAARRTAAGEIVIAAAACGRSLSPRAGPLRAPRRGLSSIPGANRQAPNGEGAGTADHKRRGSDALRRGPLVKRPENGQRSTCSIAPSDVSARSDQ
jgi:hypothetical protein